MEDAFSYVDYDEELILQIGDLYLEDDHAMESMLTSVPLLYPGDPMSLLINGQSGTAPLGSSDSSCEPWVMNVKSDKTYRIRLIGSTSISLVLFGFEGHDNLTIIETDNSYVYGVPEIPYMQVDTGQRFSFLLNTKSSSELATLGCKTRFWIQFETREGEATVFAWAILNYTDVSIPSHGNPSASSDVGGPDASPPSPPTTQVSSECFNCLPDGPIIDLPTVVTGWLEYTFQNPPLPGYESPPPSSEVTRRITISTSQFLNGSSGHTLMISNNETWADKPPLGPTTLTPYLVELFQNGSVYDGLVPDFDRGLSNGGFDPISQTYPARLGEVLEIVWQNAASTPDGIYGPHPMHAHGGPHWDMGSGPGLYTPDTHASILKSRSINGNPYPGSRRDTTLLYKYRLQADPGELDGWRVWRLRITEKNVGVWMMHCHILQHMIMGQQTVWVFGTPDEIRAHVIPVSGNLDGFFSYGGDVVGKTGEEAEGIDVVHFFDD